MEAAVDLVVTDLGPNRLAVISFIRQHLHLGPADAEEATSKLPIKVADGSPSGLWYLCVQLEQLGATISFRGSTFDYSGLMNDGPSGTKTGKPRIMFQWLFVYGTLKRRSRHPMAQRLARDAHWIGTAKVAGRLYDLGRFPGLKKPLTETDWVIGDVYDLGKAPHLFGELDAYENAESPAPAIYARQPATVFLDDGRVRAISVYWYRGPVSEEQFIGSGSYEVNCDPIT